MQDVPLSQRDIEQLRDRLPGVDVGWPAAVPRERRPYCNSAALRLCSQSDRAGRCALVFRGNRKVDLDNDLEDRLDLPCEHQQ